MDGTTIWTWFLNLKGFKEAQGTMDGLGNSVNKNFAGGKKALDDYIKTLEKSDKQTQQAARQQRRAWVMAWMSIMWFSFTVKRMLEGFARSAVDTFMKVTDANNELNRGFTYLTATWEYFKFSFINTALGPILMAILPTLIDITDQITDWMNQNPEMAKMLGYLLIMGIVLGTILFWVAQVGLLSTGLSGVGFAAEAAGGSVSILGISLSMSLGAALLLIGEIIVIIAVLYLMWKNNFGGMQQSVANIWDYIIKFISDVGSLFGELFGLIDSLLAGDTAGWETHFVNILKLIGRFVVEAVGILWNIGTGFYSIMVAAAKLALNTVLDVFAVFYNTMAGLAEQIPGVGKQYRMDVTQAKTAVSNAADFMTAPVIWSQSELKKKTEELINTQLALSGATLETTSTISTATAEQQKYGAILNSTSGCVSQTTEASKFFNATIGKTEVSLATTSATIINTVNPTLDSFKNELATHTVPAITGVETAFSQTADTANAATKAIQDYNAMAADYDRRWGTGSWANQLLSGGGGGGGITAGAGTTTTTENITLAKNQFYDPNTKSVFTVDPAYIPLYTEQIISQGPNQPGITGAFPALTPTTMAEQTGWGSTPRGQQWLATANIPALQGGGIISKAGLFNLHAGEAVVPAGDNYSYGGINISINNPVVRSEADIDDLAKKVGDKIKDAISRRVRLV